MPNSEPTLAVFRSQTFRMLWIATLASNFGGLVHSVGSTWMMTALTSSQSMAALVHDVAAIEAGSVPDRPGKSALSRTGGIERHGTPFRKYSSI